MTWEGGAVGFHGERERGIGIAWRERSEVSHSNEMYLIALALDANLGKGCVQRWGTRRHAFASSR